MMILELYICDIIFLNVTANFFFFFLSSRTQNIGRGKRNCHVACVIFFHCDLAIATWKGVLGWEMLGWRRQRLRIWRRKCTESILLCFVLTDLCVASISDNLRTTVIAQPRTRLAVNRMKRNFRKSFNSLFLKSQTDFCFLFLISVSETSRPNWLRYLI